MPYINNYAAGNELQLFPHPTRGRPYGRSIYPWPPPESHAHVDKYPTGYDPTQDVPVDQHLYLRVVRTISGGAGPQVVLLEVITCPRTQSISHTWLPKSTASEKAFLVAKIFDHECYSDNTHIMDGPYSAAERADQDRSIEVAVYSQLFLAHLGKDGNKIIHAPGREKLTGGSSFTPEYFGSWVIKLSGRGSPPDNERYVGAILMEYIDGYSIRDYCTRSLVPLTEERPGKKCMPQLEDRLEVFRQIVDGAVRHKKHGVTHEEYEPRDILIVEKDDEPPRVVKVGYSLSTVWRFTARAMRTGKRRTVYMELPKPIHPLDWVNCTLGDFYQLDGWYPTEWASKQERRKPKSESMFGKWLLKTFGEVREGEYSLWSTYENSLLKQEKGP